MHQDFYDYLYYSKDNERNNILGKYLYSNINIIIFNDEILNFNNKILKI
jgi:hypothetical protein